MRAGYSARHRLVEEPENLVRPTTNRALGNRGVGTAGAFRRVVMIRRWNVVLTLPANGPHQVTAVTSMVAFELARPKKPAVKKTRVIRPSTFIAAQLSLSA
jgi:hypothetical protein